MAIESKYNVKVLEADTLEEIEDTVFRSNELVKAKDTGDIKLGNGVDKYSDLDDFGGDGTPGPQGEKGDKGDPGEDGADGFGTEAQYNDIISRLEALEEA